MSSLLTSAIKEKAEGMLPKINSINALRRAAISSEFLGVWEAAFTRKTSCTIFAAKIMNVDLVLASWCVFLGISLLEKKNFSLLSFHILRSLIVR